MATCPTCRTRYDDQTETCASDGDTLVPDAVFANAELAIAPGTMIGEYRVEGKLGEGAFGQVFRAIHPMIGKHAAIKVLGRALSYDPQMVSRFIAEARAVNQIRHKNIIDVFGFGALPDGRQWYAMELLEGVTFDGFLKQRGHLPIEEALPILRGIARALDAAHAKGIFHRDLKPENVFLVDNDDGPPEPKLLDFGIAKLSKKGSSSHKTATGAAMGTPYYMSPEQCRGHEIDARTDVYAFGVMAFEVLTGTLPFESENALELLLLHLNEPVPSASARRPTLAPAFDPVFARLMAKDKEARPASATAALEELAAAGGIAVSRSGGARIVPSGPTQAASSSTAVNAATMPISSASSAEPGALSSQPAPATAVTMPSQTLGAQATDVRVPSRVSGKTYAAVAALAVVLGAAGVVLVRPLVSGAAATTPSTTAATTTAAPPTSAPPTATLEPLPSAAPKATVAVTLTGVPDDAEVALGDTPLGKGSGPFVVPRGPSPITLTVVAKGMKPATVKVDPSADSQQAVKLEKAAGGGAATKPVGKPTGPISKDIAVPDFKP